MKAKGLASLWAGVAACLLMVPNLLQAAELIIPEQFDVLSVNGADYPFTIGLEKTVQLQPGRNVVVLEYDKIYDAVYGDSHDRIKSAPFGVVLHVQANDKLRLDGPAFDNGTDARRYAKSPTVTVHNAEQKTVAVQLVPVQQIGEALVAKTEGLAKTENVAPTPSPTNAESASMTASKAMVSTASAVAATPAADGKPAINALDMLNYWWQQATPEQRAAFLQGIVR